MSEPRQIPWREEFSVGVPDVDHEHRELIALINELLSLMAGSKERSPEVSAGLGEVYACITAHFALEERVMREARYDGYAEHKEAHEQLMEEIRDMMDEYDGGTAVDLDAFAARLDRWFSEHFRTMDARFHRHLPH